MTTLSTNYVLKFIDHLTDSDHAMSLPQGETLPDLEPITALYAKMLRVRYYTARACSTAGVPVPDCFVVVDMDGQILGHGQMPRTACVEDLTFLCVWVCMFFLAEHD